LLIELQIKRTPDLPSLNSLIRMFWVEWVNDEMSKTVNRLNWRKNGDNTGQISTLKHRSKNCCVLFDNMHISVHKGYNQNLFKSIVIHFEICFNLV